MAQQRKPFDKLFSQLQDIRDKDGKLLNTVLWSQKGKPSVLFEIENPVQQYCTDADLYCLFQDVLANIIKTLGEGYALQKQDIFCKQEYHHKPEGEQEFLTESYFNYFEGREYTDIRTFLIVTQECAHNAFVKYDAKRWEDFHVKVAKVADILQEKGIAHRKLSKSEIDEYLHRFMTFQFKQGPFSMTNFKCSEETPLKTYYTDRQRLPVAIDITGKEGVHKYTDNANFFCIGPSGSGKSFHMNSVVRQLLEQNTDVVMVDTGDSYEGICSYFGGTYITYSKEHPISMNPFKITKTEYRQNFGEKKNFLKSLIFLIFKGSEMPSKIEDAIINQVIVEYYDAFFHPFRGFSAEEKDRLRHRLLLEDKKNGEYEKYGEKVEHSYYQDFEGYQGNTSASVNAESRDTIFSEAEVAHHIKAKRQVVKLHALVNDQAATEGEKVAANRQLMRLMAEVIEGSYLMRIEQKIEKMEQHRRKMTVRKLSFNTFYEYALERIPQLMTEKKIAFDIDNFAAILEQFYRGGELECTLNNDLEQSLFDERFIVFEIDKIKDDPVLFPIVVLIIMDVFLQKMRIKKGRKALIIEEAWKAIASPTMAEYIKYLYKTVRKFHGIAGVVTQELNDVIDSPIVKEAIINNSDVKILLDQAKFKDRYDDIAAILGLTAVQRQQIFTINSLNNHEGRNYFKEVWICRGQVSDVYGVEEPPECYWAYTTERAEKEALKIYTKHYGGNIQRAITEIEKDRRKAGISKYLDFARHVNEHQNIMSLWKS